MLILLAIEWKDGVAYRVGKTVIGGRSELGGSRLGHGSKRKVTKSCNLVCHLYFSPLQVVRFVFIDSSWLVTSRSLQILRRNYALGTGRFSA